MRRFKIQIEYDGTNYCGWQSQKNAPTIQATIEDALADLNKNRRVVIIGSGRTDSGVHALGQMAHFDLETKLAPETIKNAVNAKTPEDILIRKCSESDPKFHSRFWAKKRHYLYRISTTPTVIDRNFCWQYKSKFDFSKLNKCAELIIGQHDFTGFCKSTDEAESKVCKIFKSSWNIDKNFINYTIVGNRFLHSMVRMLAGTMMETAKGKLNIIDFKNIFENKKNRKSVFTAPAKGLFLTEVEY